MLNGGVDYLYFNPRSREGSDIEAGSERLKELDFNPRSREGSDVYRYSNIKRIQISIHAPARGATEGNEQGYQQRIISIHAPARGATLQG